MAWANGGAEMKETAQPRRWGKMKKTDWHDQPRQSRLASVMYPHLASEETQKQMADLAAREGKRSPQAAKAEADRGKPSPFAKRKI